MALLPLDLDQIESVVTAESPPAGWTQGEVDAVIAFRRKIRSTILYFARQLGAGQTLEIAGRPDFPSAEEGSAEPQEAAGWSQRVLTSPDSVLDQAFRIALYNDVDAPLASKALVVAIGTTNDAANRDALRNALAPLLPILTKGFAPGR